jgi:GTP-binding protein
VCFFAAAAQRKCSYQPKIIAFAYALDASAQRIASGHVVVSAVQVTLSKPILTHANKSLAVPARLERIARFAGASFVTSAVDIAGFPTESGAEYAFVGRSNAGKSSTINKLVGQNRLAYASKMPGRTRELNFFALRGGGHLVDLPGYGFARTPRDKQRVWSGLIDEYLATRASLRCVVLVSDIRHAPHEMDLRFLQWLGQIRSDSSAPKVLWLLNKADKLTQSERIHIERNTINQLASATPYESVVPIIFSAHTGLGMKSFDAHCDQV